MPDAEVLPEEDLPAPTAPLDVPKVDDAALISKALDELEALQRKGGAKGDLAAARQALRRLAALARLKTGDRG